MEMQTWLKSDLRNENQDTIALVRTYSLAKLEKGSLLDEMLPDEKIALTSLAEYWIYRASDGLLQEQSAAQLRDW